MKHQIAGRMPLAANTAKGLALPRFAAKLRPCTTALFTTALNRRSTLIERIVMFKIAAAIFVASATLAANTAFAQAKPEDAIAYRQGAFKIIGWNFGPMAGMVQGRIPYDKDGFAKRAANVAAVAAMPFEGFGPGTDAGAPTKAKAEVWSKSADFKAKADKMVEETTKLAAIAKTGSLDDIKKQFGATGATCKACHDDYRNK